MADSKSNTLSLQFKEEENVLPHHHQLLSIFIPASPPLSSSSSSSPLTSPVEDLALSVSSKKNGDVNGGDHVNGDDDEIGYHTPTSPEHRIQPSVDCPPAPKKTIQGSQRRKRKASWSVRREWFHVELLSAFMEVDGVWLMKKKDRREEEINESY